MAEENLVLAWYDQAGDQWVELDGIVDTDNNTITASIDHFTTFVIMGKVTSALESEPESEALVAVFRISELDISPGEPETVLISTPPVTPVSWPVIYGIVVALLTMGALLFFLARRRHIKPGS